MHLYLRRMLSANCSFLRHWLLFEAMFKCISVIYQSRRVKVGLYRFVCESTLENVVALACFMFNVIKGHTYWRTSSMANGHSPTLFAKGSHLRTFGRRVYLFSSL